LLSKVTAAVSPNDIIEEFWVRDIVDLVWETHRLRRLKTSLLAASTIKGLSKVLEPLVEFLSLKPLVEAWYARDAAAGKDVEALLQQAGLTMNHVLAQTLSRKLDDIERIDRMIANAEARRHVVLREIDRHRDALATRLRAAVEAIEDGDYEEVVREVGAPPIAA
jgi:ribosomal protein L12E/L44/L45/RPP1/RPP2